MAVHTIGSGYTQRRHPGCRPIAGQAENGDSSKLLLKEGVLLWGGSQGLSITCPDFYY